MKQQTNDNKKNDAAERDGQAARISLSLFVENPDNPSVATEEDIARLAGKLKRVPLGLTAMRIAYVTDTIKGKRMVISGNKRLRVLKRAFGEDGEVPSEWFADVTAMSEAERHEFIVTANVSDGEWDAERLLAQYDKAELGELMPSVDLDRLLVGIEEHETQGETDADAVPEVPEEPKSKRGSVYQMGRHRVMCGDSMCDSDVDTLVCGRVIDTEFIDPPFDKEELYSVFRFKNKAFVFSDHKHFASAVISGISAGLIPRWEFVWNCCQSWYTPNRPLARHKQCFVFGSDERWDFDNAIIKDGKTREEKIVRNTRGYCDYHPLDGAVHFRTCEEFPNTSESDEHGHGKPVKWIYAMMMGYAGESICDYFGGSGAVVIASEMCGKSCVCMEICPKYVDIIRKRWAEFVHGEGCDWEKLTPEIYK